MLTGALLTAQAQADTGLDWHRCPGGEADMECASIEVPVDWGEPDGRRITVMLGRLPANKSPETARNVLVNPGGFVGNSIEYLARGREPFARLRERTNIVTWDIRGGPMGAGYSTALKCEWTAIPLPKVPGDREEFDELASANRERAETCRDTDPALFDNMDAASHAKDMDAIREALGDRQLNLHMTSAGGLLAQSYAREFPKRLRTMYVDGIIDHSGNRDSVYDGYATDGEAAFERFLDWCRRTDACALHDESDVSGRWRALVKQANEKPIPAGRVKYDGRDLQDSAVRILRMRTPDPAWRDLAQAILDAEGGDASGFVTDPEHPVSAVPVPAVVECLDFPAPTDHTQVRDTVRRLNRLAPNTGGRLQLYGAILTCVGWPTPPRGEPGPLPQQTPPALGAGTWNDYDATDRVVSPTSGVTIAHDGPGHGLYWNGDACVIKHADRYLTTRKLPKPGTSC